MHFLDAGGIFSGDDDFVFSHAFQSSAVFADQRQRMQSGFVGGLYRANEIFRIAATGKDHQKIAGLSESLHLPFEDGCIVPVVGDAGQNRRIRVEADRRKRPAGS